LLASATKTKLNKITNLTTDNIPPRLANAVLSVAEILKKLTKMARVKTNRVHYDDNGKKHEVSKEKGENKYYIKNTEIEVTGKTTFPKGHDKHYSNNYDYSKPFDAQNLGDEWDDYAWSGDDF